MVDWAEWEIKLMFWKTSKDSALWVKNGPAKVLEGARMERFMVDVWWDAMLLINIPCFRQVVEVAE